MDSTFVYVTYIQSTPEKIWEALTTAAISEKYFFGRRIYAEWKEGETVTFLRENDELDVSGRILICEHLKKLSYTWNHADDTPREHPSVATFELHALNDTVKLVLTHDNLLPTDSCEDKGSFEGVNNGWPAILSNLKTLLETGSTLPAVVV
ncbi:SRPBCC family protein [Caldibacillus lycopersici]|uniref:SRPBCC family protein n=1 Tax=Perspicuibacillus lycopersici TaxID=1325689 RepID=A0AAE3IU13_9BACI|nr:SRPBCC family protein [Perspicuibacillus lycopersici]MCU9614615.1 SRPBCC family protein [Perspicuibacillus lycopersici]